MTAALHSTAMRAQRAAADLLKSYVSLALARSPNNPVLASDAVAVKTLVARQVEEAYRAALPSELQFALADPSSDVVWRPRPYEPAGYGSYLFRWEPCPACPAWGDMYGHLESGGCSDEECTKAGSSCWEHDEEPPTTAHSQAFTCPTRCLALVTEQELEAASVRIFRRQWPPCTAARGRGRPTPWARWASEAPQAHRPCSSISRIRFRLRFWAVRRAVTYAVNSSFGVPRRRWQSRMLSSRLTSFS